MAEGMKRKVIERVSSEQFIIRDLSPSKFKDLLKPFKGQAGQQKKQIG